MEHRKEPADEGGAGDRGDGGDGGGTSDTSGTTLPGAEAPAPPVARAERRRRSVGWRSGDVLRTALLVIALYVVLKLLWVANELVFVVFLGVLFGLAVSAGVDRLQRLHVPRGVGAALIVVAFFAVLSGIGAWIAPTLRSQGAELREELPHAVDKIEAWLDRRQSGLLGMLTGGAPLGGTAVVQRDSTLQARADTLAARDTVRQRASSGSLRDALGRQVSGLSRYLFPFLTSTIAVVGGVLLVIFLAVYVGADPGLYRRGLMHLFPHRARDEADDVLGAMAFVMRRWLVTQLIAMIVIGVVTTIILLVLRVQAAFALGVIAGLLEFIPTIGPTLSAIPAIAMGFLDSPEKAASVALAYVGIQFLENHLLIPLLMEGGVDLPPALTIITQALMALLFGFLGLMVAVPMLAAAMVPIKRLYVERVVGDPVELIAPDDDDAGAPGADAGG